jgi:hypothetical protein
VILQSYYLSEPGNLERAAQDTGLAADEIEALVGRFAKHSSRAGRLHGEVAQAADGSWVIRHDFKKRMVLWKGEKNA